MSAADGSEELGATAAIFRLVLSSCRLSAGRGYVQRLGDNRRPYKAILPNGDHAAFTGAFAAASSRLMTSSTRMPSASAR